MRRRTIAGSLLLLALAFSLATTGCAGDACHAYFQQLKSRCRLTSTSEGAKLDRFLEQPFAPCQIEICERVSVNDIDCSDPETHIPGGMSGRFESCSQDNPGDGGSS